jgi:hypothetical protein
MQGFLCRMHIGLISYQTGHLKTRQLIDRLWATDRVTVYAFPFKYREVPAETRYPDRPDQLIALNMRDYCRAKGVDYVEVGGWNEQHAAALDGPDVYLMCIGKIVPAHFIKGRTIINAHPGLLPVNRGVDAFKWSIVRGAQLGVSLHIIDEKIDAGTCIGRRVVEVFNRDTLRTTCDLAYEIEVEMMAGFERYLKLKKWHFEVGDEYPVSHERIPADMDRRLESIFEANRKRYQNATFPIDDDGPGMGPALADGAISP